jgi:hypothetical protein
MRYRRFKTIVKKMADIEVAHKEEIQALLSSIKEKEITCSVRFASGPRQHE